MGNGGALAIDSGLYGPKYGSDHHLNYTYQKGSTLYCEISGAQTLKISFAQDLSNSNFQSTF